MSKLLWGKVFYQDIFAGYLREEPGHRISFIYDASYLQAGHPAIAHTLPLQLHAHVSVDGLLPFFDNLVAEGWLEHAQKRLLGHREGSRFSLLLAFGYDCAGAVSVVDPDPEPLSRALVDPKDPREIALLTSRASLSGVQPKLAVVRDVSGYRPAKIGELSTHIAKFPSLGHDNLVVNEYLTSRAFHALLPQEPIVQLKIGQIHTVNEPALLIERFDRNTEGSRLHFEEFLQLLGKSSRAKYQDSYTAMARFIRDTPGCLQTENYRLYTRILAGLLLGNTDMHLKNFAMFHTAAGLRLSPVYDQVCAIVYGYKTVALAMGNLVDFPLMSLKPKHLIGLGIDFGLSKQAIEMAVMQLGKNCHAAKEAIFESDLGRSAFKDTLIHHMEARWKGTFALIGKTLSKKQ